MQAYAAQETLKKIVKKGPLGPVLRANKVVNKTLR